MPIMEYEDHVVEIMFAGLTGDLTRYTGQKLIFVIL